MADLDELERLLAAASPRPWRTYEGNMADAGGYGIADTDPGDAALVVALVNAAPALIAAARERDRLRGEPYVELWEAAEEDRGAAAAEAAALRALCREAAAALRGCEPWTAAEIDLHQRLRAAGGGT